MIISPLFRTEVQSMIQVSYCITILQKLSKSMGTLPRIHCGHVINNWNYVTSSGQLKSHKLGWVTLKDTFWYLV